MNYKKYKLDSVFTVTDLVNISYYRLSKGYRSPGESHEFWEFVYIDKGSLVVTADTTKYLLKAGELVFHCPNEFHVLQAVGQSPVNVIVISFYCNSPSMSAFKNKIIFPNQQEKQCLTSIVKESEASYAHFDNVAPLVNMIKKDSAPFGSDQLIKTSLEQLFIYIYRRDDNIYFSERSISTNRLQHRSRIASEIQEYLDEHFNEKITLTLLAEHFNISSSQLKQIFKEHTSSTVVTYLTNVRISEAKRMIREKSLNFSQIAEAVGYDNIHYFSAQFKKHTSMTPTEYSKSVRD